jgi:hypothetical protein
VLALALVAAAAVVGVVAMRRPAPAPLRYSYVAVDAASPDTAAPPVTDDCGTTQRYTTTQSADGNVQTAWAVSGTGAGATLTLALPARMRVTHVDVIPGDARVDACTGVDAWYQNRRVESASLEFSAGAPVAHTFDAAAAQFQRVDVHGVETTFVRIHILSSAAAGGPQVIGDARSPTWDPTDLHDAVPISEVRVWAAPLHG